MRKSAALQFGAAALAVGLATAPALAGSNGFGIQLGIDGPTQSFSVTCAAPQGEDCRTPAIMTFTADGQPGLWTIRLTAPATHCSSVAYYATGPSGLGGPTGPLAPGQGRNVVIGQDLSPGPQQVRIDATGVIGGCNSGVISSWGLTATVSRH